MNALRNLVFGLSVLLVLSWSAPVPAQDAPSPVWAARPAPADAPVTRHACRIVDFGDDLARGDTGASFATSYRMGRGAPPFQSVRTVDVDGDGATNDDFVAYLPFSLDEPLSPPGSSRGGYLPGVMNGTFYGGITLYYANSRDARRVQDFENYVNAEHDGPFYDRRAEDFALSGQPEGANPESKYRHYAVFLWNKADFGNGGDRSLVTFDDQSRMAVFIARYWMGFNDGRFVVRDGSALYISEQTFDIPDWIRGVNWMNGATYTVQPTRTRWAEYRPEGYRIEFDPAAARFEDHDFKDVQAVGWYLARPALESSETHIKWYAFEVDAVVHRAERPSEATAMVRVAGQGERVPPFFLGACEVPYALWKKVYHYATAPTYATEPGYLMLKNGDMGSMDVGSSPHGQDEPVTDITWYDALAFCNALSEREGRTPCYYTDPACTEIFRFREIATRAVVPASPTRSAVPEPVTMPPIHVKWDADGYRLPTVDEWQAAFMAGGHTAPADAAPAGDEGWDRSNSGGTTHAVGTKPADGAGLYDLRGNVWEYTWDCGAASVPTQALPRIVLGGDFNSPDDPRAAALAAGQAPYDGAFHIGFRLARRDAGGATPPAQTPEQLAEKARSFGPLGWVIPRAAVVPAAAPVAAAAPALSLVDVPAGTFVRAADEAEVQVSAFSLCAAPVTFAEWRRVCAWAQARGYAFAGDADMGSMYWSREAHVPAEPAVNLGWHDALVWCNALSEMEGRTPCYYTDAACTNAYRSAYRFLPIKIPGPELGASHHTGDAYSKYGRGRYIEPWLFVRWDADGYRLPTLAEWEYAERAGGKTAFFWGDDPKARDPFVWTMENAGGRTHPVRGKQPNALGLFDMSGHVYQWLWSADLTGEDYYDARNPKGGRYSQYGKSAGKEFPLARGSSFFWERSDHPGFGLDPTLGYPDVGFRVARCAAGTHPRDGVERVDRVVLDIDPAAYDPLEQSCYRGNLRRDGVCTGPGPAALTKARWTFKTGAAVKSSPVVKDGVVFFGSNDGFFYAVNAADGKEKWKVEVKGAKDKGVESSACVADGVVYFSGKDGVLYAVDAASGEVRHRFVDAKREWNRPSERGSPAVAFGHVFAYLGGALRGFDVKTGAQDWLCRESSGPVGRGAVPLFEGQLFAGGGWGAFNAVNLRSERTVWTGHCQSTGQCNTPAVGESNVYVISSVGLDAFDLATGRKRWTAKVDPAFVMNEFKPNASPALWNGMVYFGMETGCVYAYDAMRGQEKWTASLGQPVRSSPTIADGRLYVGCNDGQLRILDAATGEVKSAFKTGGPIESTPWVAGGLVFVGSDDGSLYAIE